MEEPLDNLFDAAENGENREERLEELARQVSVCTKCDLALSRTNTVFGTGDPHSPLMLVGEGTGRERRRHRAYRLWGGQGNSSTIFWRRWS